MAARRKPMELVNPTTIPLRLDNCQEPARSAIAKDICLLQAALATDHIIVTRDQKLQDALITTPDGIALTRTIRWINPISDDLEVFKSL